MAGHTLRRIPLTKKPKRATPKEDRVFKVTVYLPNHMFLMAVDETHAQGMALRFIDKEGMVMGKIEEWSEDTVDADIIFRDEQIADKTVH
jgi:hypothetical protein